MTTRQATAMNAVVSLVRPVLKPAGFRKRGNAFNREAAPGLVHVIHFQMGRFSPPGTAGIPGLRQNLYGKFTVNLGVYLDQVNRFQDLPPAGNFVSEYSCQLRRRLGFLLDPPEDRWWPLDNPAETGRVMRELVGGPGLDWLKQYGSWTAIRDALETAPSPSRIVSGGPDRLLATRMRLAEGDVAAAQRNFSAWIATVDRQRPHYDYLCEFGRRHGLTLPSSQTAE